MSRLPNDDLGLLMTQMALYTGPALLGAHGSNDTALLSVLSEGCADLTDEIGGRLRDAKRVRFIDIQRESLWLADELATSYVRPGDCLLDHWTQYQLRAYILRSLRCMGIISDERYIELRETIYHWAVMMHELLTFTAAYGGRSSVTA